MANKKKAATTHKAVIDNPLAANLRNFLETVAIELPSAAVRSASNNDAENEKSLAAAGWKAYDQAIALINSATNALYTSDSFNTLARAALDATVQMQRLQASMAGAFFASLWPAVGLPTADDVESLHAQVRSLRADLAQERAEREQPAQNMVDRFSILRKAIAAGPVRQVSVWTGWNGVSMTEHDDVGN